MLEAVNEVSMRIIVIINNNITVFCVSIIFIHHLCAVVYPHQESSSTACSESSSTRSDSGVAKPSADCLHTERSSDTFRITYAMGFLSLACAQLFYAIKVRMLT